MSLIKISLKQTLFVAFLAVAIVPVVILSGWEQHSAFKKELAAVKEKHLLLARNLTDALSRYAIDTQVVFQSALAAHENGHFGTETKSLMQAVNIQGLALLNNDLKLSKQLFGNQEFNTQQTIDDLSGFITLAMEQPGKVIFSGVVVASMPHPTIFMVTHRPEQGTWLAAVDTKYIQRLQQSISFGKKGHAAIVDHKGQVLAHPKQAWQQNAKNISKIKPVAAMIKGQTGVTTFYSPAVKADMIAGYATVQETGWGVMIPQPLAELKEHAAQIQLDTFILGIVAILITALFSWWLAGLIAAPVINVRDSAQQISKGNFGLKVNNNTRFIPRELSDLATAFNRMKEEVQRSQHNLEARVEERTHELQEEIQIRKAAEEKIRFMAMHDPVTGLPNRVALHDQIDQWRQKRIQGKILAVLFIDLDGFKPVNDTHGHDMGDAVLSLVGDRLASTLRNEDIVARYGGDEFVVILTNQGSAQHAYEVAQKLRQQIAEPMQLGNLQLNIAASIGVVTTAAKGADINKMLREADRAMYQAKSQGKNSVCVA
ncbi:MAG: diguanylate cyclase [Motiliproteus sp.]